MKLTFALLLASLSMVFAAPQLYGKAKGAKGAKGYGSAASATGGACTYSTNEKLNLGHNHDVNTGKLLAGGKIIKAPKIGGSGCSPAWAVGGALTDNTPTPTKTGAKGGSE